MKQNIIGCPKNDCGKPSPEIYQIADDCVHYCPVHGEFRIHMDGDISFKTIQIKKIIKWKIMKDGE